MSESSPSPSGPVPFAPEPSGPGPSTIEVIEEEPAQVLEDGDHERFAHIIRKEDQMRGYVMGEPVTALCGKRWVPARDPQRFPVCTTCREVLAAIRRAPGN